MNIRWCLFPLVLGLDSALGEGPTNQSVVTDTFRSFLECGVSNQPSCYFDTGSVILREKMDEILAQADREFMVVKGRSEDDSSAPSHLAKMINRLISEVTDMFKESFSGFFKNSREGEDEDETEEKETTKDVEEGRKKKKGKIKRLVQLIKFALVAVVIAAKLGILLKLLSAALQIKFFLVALAGLLLNAARFYLDLKKGHHPQKVIYYEHAQHQHHYEGDDDWHSSGPGGSYWGRSYDEPKEKTGHDLAYSKQKPQKEDGWFS